MSLPKKILIIRFSALGDVLNVSAVVRCIKLQTQSEIHLVTKKMYEPLFKSNPFLDKLQLLDENWNLLINKLRLESYDLVLDLHKNIRSYRLRNALKKPVISFRKEKVNKILFTKFKIDRLSNLHTVEKYFEELADIGVSYDGKGLDFYQTENTHLSLPNQFIAINISASKKTKRLNVQLVKDLIANCDTDIVLIGGADVASEGNDIEQSSQKSILNLIGKTTLDQSAQLIKKSRLLITGDTSMMHLAAALKHPMIVLWGPTTPKLGLFGLYPKGQNIVVNLLHPNLSCQPCHHIGFDTCPKGHWDCMTHFSANQLISTINELKQRN